jgi:NTE family protein
MVRAKTDEALKKLAPGDILIQPPLGHASSVDFGHVEGTFSAGVRGAEAAKTALSKYSLNDTAWATYLAGRNPRADGAPKIAFVRLDDESARYERLVDAAMQDLVGNPLDRDSMRSRLSSLYALDLFESIDYSVVDEDGQQGLVFHLKRKSWGPNYVRVGLNIEDDFEGNSRYNAAARFIMTEINSLGGEWLTDVQIGDNPKLFTEFYQPLSSARRYFLAPQFNFEIKNLFALDANDNRIAEYRVRSYEGGLDFGRELSDWGEIRAGVRRGSGRTRILVGDPALPVTYFDTGGFFYRFSYDKLDSIYFPRHGQRLEIERRAERPSMGAEQKIDTLSTSWLIARSLGRNTFVFSTDFGATLDSVSSPQYDFTLGGFLNLSGLPPSALTGPNFGIARFLYYRQIGRGGSGVLNLPVYAGVSLEAGNVWADRHDASFGDLKRDGSLFLGADTPLGPLYLGMGFAQGGDTAFYLFLGRTF